MYEDMEMGLYEPALSYLLLPSFFRNMMLEEFSNEAEVSYCSLIRLNLLAQKPGMPIVSA